MPPHLLVFSPCFSSYHSFSYYFFFFFNDPPTTEIYPLSLHDPLPISPSTILPHPPQPPLAVYYKECPSRGSHFRRNTTHTPWSARCTGAGSSAAYSRPGPTRPSLPT